MDDGICDECEGEGGVHECPTCSYEVEGCGTCGLIEEADGQVGTVADLRAQLAEVTAERDALRERLAEVHASMPGGIDDGRIYSEETVRVRIAVVTNEHGQYIASWQSNCPDADLASDARSRMPRAAGRLTWIEADVPLPTPDPVLTGIPAWQGVSWDGVMIIDEVQRTMAVDFTAVETMRQAGMFAHNDRYPVPRRRAVSAADLLHQPRNPRRRGDTGAHGRARR